MKSIMQTTKECYVTSDTIDLQKHHIYFGPNRKVSDKYGFWVWLRSDYHTGAKGVHTHNPLLDAQLKMECQALYEKTHSREEFMKLIGRNYLED